MTTFKCYDAKTGEWLGDIHAKSPEEARAGLLSPHSLIDHRAHPVIEMRFERTERPLDIPQSISEATKMTLPDNADSKLLLTLQRLSTISWLLRGLVPLLDILFLSTFAWMSMRLSYPLASIVALVLLLTRLSLQAWQRKLMKRFVAQLQLEHEERQPTL